MPFTKKIAQNMVVICLKKIVSTWRQRNSVKLSSKQSKHSINVWGFVKIKKQAFIILLAILCTKQTKMKEIRIPE